MRRISPRGCASERFHCLLTGFLVARRGPQMRTRRISLFRADIALEHHASDRYDRGMGSEDDLLAAARRTLEREIRERFPAGPEREAWLNWLAHLKPWQLPPSLPGAEAASLRPAPTLY